jgi:hypothetical protein
MATQNEVLHGWVEQRPYVGDSPLVMATCKHGDYSRLFKGVSIRHGEKALAEHYSAKHEKEEVHDGYH